MKKQRIVDYIAQKIREVFKNIDGYIVFASFALYLQQQEKGVALLNDLPNDVDIVVASQKDLEMTKAAFTLIPGIIFDNDGEFYSVDRDGELVLSGSIPVTLDGDVTYFPFEVFYHSRIVHEDTMQQLETVAGIQVLTLKGLEEQYVENYLFESQVQLLVNEIAAFLSRKEIEQRLRKNDRALQEVLESKLHLTSETVTKFYSLREALADSPTEAESAAYDSSIAELFVGQKTEVKKRLQHVKDLQRLKGL